MMDLASKIRMPYQCLASCGKVLVAARGASIDSFNEDGSLLWTWQSPSAQDPKVSNSSNGKEPISLEVRESPSSKSFVKTLLDSSTPSKRRRLSAEDEEDAQKSPERIETKKKSRQSKKGNKRLNAVVSGLETPAVVALAATDDGRHVIAVTGEDKTIRVFENTVHGDGNCFKQLSQRMMPKRPSAIVITPDHSTIISADKFGDVYSLPLLVPETTSLETLKFSAPTPEPTSAKAFVSAANHLTVHSQRNRKALENQQKQTNRPAGKSVSYFEHKLLLGHVSMLTDLALVTNPEGRNYILTADRDEHIRVSRGIPQAHIIEGFCLGHTEFISRLCIPKERPDVLISGGGDECLFVWDWASGSVVYRSDLRGPVGHVLHEVHGQDLEGGNIDPFKIAVSGIKHIRQAGSEGFDDQIIVTCEGIPAVFAFLLTPQNQLAFIQTLRLPGNVLDIATDAVGGIVVSIDTIHRPASTIERREVGAKSLAPLQKLSFENRRLVPAVLHFEVAKRDDEIEDVGRLRNSFYSVEKLRKTDDGREEDY